MAFSEIAKRLGLETYPAEMDGIYQSLKKGDENPISREALVALQDQLGLYGTYFDDVLVAFENLKEDKDLFDFANVAALYQASASYEDARKLPYPPMNRTPARDLLPVFLWLERIKIAVEQFQKRGFTKDEICELMGVFKDSIAVNEVRYGRPCLDWAHFSWISHYLYCRLFTCGGFNYNFTQNSANTTVLKNKKSGEVAVLTNGAVVHREGYILGSAGKKDEEGSFTTSVFETEDEWIGNATNERGLIEAAPRHFSKEDWELAVAPGDPTLNIHIPRDADISPEAVRKSVDEAYRIVKERFSDRPFPKAIQCASWMMNPILADLCGKESKIASFGGLFTRQPMKCPGTSVFSFVFRVPEQTPIDELPENTSLQRKIKAIYQNGGFFNNFNAYLLP